MVMRISQAGSCPRRIALEAQGVEGIPLSESTKRAFAEGNLHESSIIQWACENLPHAPYESFGDQTEVTVEGTPIVGHIDGLLFPQDAEKPVVLIEAKCLAARSFQELRRKGVKKSHPQYYTQIQLYRHCFELEGFERYCERPLTSYIIARNKQTPPTRQWDHHYEEVSYDPEFCETEVDRLCRLAERIEQGEDISIPDGWTPDTQWNCRFPWCPYTNLCHPDWRRQRVEVVQKDDLGETVEQYQELGEQISELSAERAELKERLMASVDGQPVQAGRYIVSCTERRTERFDTKAARQVLAPDVLAGLLNVTTSKYLKIEGV